MSLLYRYGLPFGGPVPVLWWTAGNFSRVGPAVLFIGSAPYDNTEEGIRLR